MADFSAEIKDGMLIVKVPLEQPPKPSGSKKTLVIASTHGNKPTSLNVKGGQVYVGVNAYVRA
jgi:hypothetical protein